MDFDPLAQQQSDRIFQVWIQNLVKHSPEELAGKLASRHCPGTPATASRLSNGAFNICYRVTFKEGLRVVVRFAALGRVIARREKVEDEVAVMEYVAKHTEIPVPKVLGSGNCVVGPYIVMDFIDGNPLSEHLRDPSQETATLNPSIPMSVLKRAYFGMAEVLLELSKPEFPFIGAIRQDELGNWVVQKRPLTFNMNRLAQFSNIPFHVFERRRFNNAAEYFEELASHHLHHFEFQRNDAVTDEADCRKKYIARCLFRKLSREISKEHCNGPFRIFCDDLCPDNVLIGPNLVVTGVVDWEFAYAAPVEYTYAAPWWLLLERPEDWEPDLNQFLVRFMPRFRTFLDALKDCETGKIKRGTLSESQRLSATMERSFETGLFWICLASRHSSMFDEIYWNYIDQTFFGSFTTLEDRLHLLSAEERNRIDIVVREKTKQGIRPSTNLSRVASTGRRTARCKRTTIVNRVPTEALRAKLHARIQIPTRLTGRLALLHRVARNIIRDGQRARLGRVGIAAQTLPDGHDSVQAERVGAAADLRSGRGTGNVTLRRGDSGAVVHDRRAAEALRSELHACIGEAGLGAGRLAGLHRVARDEDGGVEGAVVCVVRVAAEAAPAERRVDSADAVAGLAACAAVDGLAAAITELAAAVAEGAAGAGCASVVGAAESVEGDGLSGEECVLSYGLLVS
ncbi:hypothetical protein Aspvir_004132 [Aspergillus viridinutans]|uniref:Aminoglycoside phosphotransferase domain-containing protein n=1 Tax=Aspergillus viridinutans TaxID=75553 RepID=A0A9P3BX20_ASPVI|nr:uncharacterized protein Aspvir_004132 [Aspergillus viridinutans]GIK00114.1 hypothetical protein Aspvir_004132 [Aspergillus viridinutans]